MKKFLLFVTLITISFNVSFAQTDVTRFLGIRVDGSKSEMIRKLEAKGFTEVSYRDCLSGRFNGQDVYVYIVTENNKVYRVMVATQNTFDETNIKILFNNLYSQFKNNSKYMELSLTGQSIDDDVDISYQMHVKNKRFEATFYQKPSELELVNLKREAQNQLEMKYTKEQLENPTDDILYDITKAKMNFLSNHLEKKVVWFMIQDFNGEYYINIYYDNRYNQANGEDL